MKRTKIIATVGPACEDEESLRHLIGLGVNVFRLNFKHNEPAWHEAISKRIRTVAQETGAIIGVLLDLQGPEIRMQLGTTSIELNEGQPVVLGEGGIMLSHPEIVQHLVEGERVVMNDGQFECIYTKKDGKDYVVPKQAGTLFNNKSMNVPDADIPLEVLTQRDFIGIEIAAKQSIDFVALSFVRTALDVLTIKTAMKQRGCTAKVIAKIEAKKAIKHLDDIIEASDAIMVARGDLGVELPPEQVPYYQKKIIRKCFAQGVPVITATQMLESMIENPYPTRAEVSDIANAVFDMTDAIMLSGESALGKYPQEAVRVMAQTAVFNENAQKEDVRDRYQFTLSRLPEHLCDAAYNIYHSASAGNEFSCFLVMSQTGRTAQLVSRYHPHVPVFAVVPDESVARSLTLNYGVYPLVKKTPRNSGHRAVEEDSLLACFADLKNSGLVKPGSRVIVIHGDIWGQVGGASVVRIMTT